MPQRDLFDEIRKRKLAEYQASHTELALEELCSSFGTELEPARFYMAGPGSPLLTRVARPIVVSSSRLGRQMLQFQYTKFSILHVSPEHLVRVYERCMVSRRREKKVTQEEVMRYIENQLHGRGVEAVTDTEALEHMHFRRFPKAVYVAAFPAKKGEKREPFLIHDAYSSMYTHKPATFYINFHVSPRFFSVGCAEPEQGDHYVHISWPDFAEEVNADLERAVGVVGVDRFSPRHKNRFDETIKIPPNVPREATMMFIRAFIKQSLDGTVF